MAADFRPLGENVVHSGPVFDVAIAEVEAPDGRVLVREIVRHPGAVMVVPVLSGNEAVLVRQYRPAIDTHLLEIPAGKRDVRGEPPADAAARELREEVGLVAGSLTLLGEFYNTPGFSDEYSFCFLGTDCEEVGDNRQGAEEEHMTLERVALAQVPELVASGELVDAKSIIGLMLARDRLDVR